MSDLQAGRIHHQAGRLFQAAESYRAVLAREPGNAEALELLGMIEFQLHHFDAAAMLFMRADAAAPGRLETLLNLGNAQAGAERFADAAETYRRVLDVAPGDGRALLHLGLVNERTGDLKAAIDCFSRLLESEPGNLMVRLAHAQMLLKAGRFEAAAEQFREAAKSDPRSGEAALGLADALRGMGRLVEATIVYEQCLGAAPGNSEISLRLSDVYLRRGVTEKAVEVLQGALGRAPNDVDALFNIAKLHRLQGDAEAAVAASARAVELSPDDDEIAATHVQHLQEACAWGTLAEAAARADALTARAIEAGGRVGESPFVSITRTMDPEINFRVARAASRAIAGAAAGDGETLPHRPKKSEDAPITLGYLSSDFRDHPLSHLMVDAFGRHDRGAFRVVGYSHGPDDGSSFRKRMERVFDSFVDLRGVGDADAAKRIRKDGVDILIDLNGHTTGGRMGICARRPAPLNVAYLGFPGSSGADFFDYVVADRIVAPPEHEAFYSEKFLYLPDTYYVTNANQEIGKPRPNRTEAGLPEVATVLASFNQSYKIEPEMFGVWMEILDAVPDAVLWLLEPYAFAKANLRREAEALGIAGERLVFAESRPKDRHLARLGLADLALDTRVYGGHTTTVDALFVDVPVIAVTGGHFASRASTSILAAAGMADLACPDLDTYRARAIELASDAAARAGVVEDLRKLKETAPLFDTARWVGNLEAGLRQAWEIYRAGEAPRIIDVES